MEIYLTNDNGDVYARVVNGETVQVDPDLFGWASPGGKTRPEKRRALDQVESLPGFTVVMTPRMAFVPGRRLDRSVPWGSWATGHTPPAAARSRDGINGTLAYFNRLTEAIGFVAQRLLFDPKRSPFLVDDFIGGRESKISYSPPPLAPGGRGSVYIVDDGYAFKIGHTLGYTAVRIAGLQTGNPRLIREVATISSAGEDIEAHLHGQLDQWNLRAEWFKRDEMLAAVNAAGGGWEDFLRSHLPGEDWHVSVNTDWKP